MNHPTDSGFFPDGLIFDIDGTLWDATGVVADAWNRILTEHHMKPFLTADRLKQEFGKPLKIITKDLLPDLPDKECADLSVILAAAEPVAVRAHQPYLYEGIEHTLAVLSTRYPLFVVTNAEQGYIETLYESTGFGKYFTDQLCFGDTGRPKGENIRLIADRHHLKDPVYIGDTLGDMEAAHLAEVRFVHASYGYGTVPECDFSIEEPEDLLRIFAAKC